MRNRTEHGLRWADLDQLGHVNNVRYIHYLIDARRAFLAEHAPELVDTPTIRLELGYRSSLLLSRRPVVVDTSAREGSADDLEFAITDGKDEPALAMDARAVIGEHPGPRAAAAPGPGRLFDYPIRMRHADLGPDGTVAEPTVVEYLQESRVSLIADLAEGRKLPGLFFVVAQIDLDLHAPLAEHGRYRVVSRIAKVGRKSLTITSQFLDETDACLVDASVVVVFVEAATQTPTEPGPEVRAVMTAACEGYG